jgi:type I restriction enzyme S subunit
LESELCSIAPAEWDILAIEDVCTRVTSGGTPSRKEPAFYSGGNWPWVKTQELLDGWIDDTEEHITAKAIDSSSAKVLPTNTVLVAMYGATVGQLGLLRRPMACNQASCALIVDPEKADFRYLFFVLLSIRRELKALATGAAQQNLSGTVIKSLRLPFPPLPEQRAIAHILGTLDDKIELNRRMSETLEAMARALFKSWFVDFEPVRAKAEGRDPGLPQPLADLFPDSFEDSELGEIPRGWEVKALGDMLELAYGKALKAEDRRDGNIPVYGSNGQVGWHDERLVIGPGIVVGRKGNPGIATWVATDFFAIDTTFYVVQRAGCRSLAFLFHALRTHDLASLGADSAVPGLNRNLAYMSRQVLPPAPLRDQFEHLASVLSKRFQRARDEIRSLAALRDALLPKLISGELRVERAEELVS